MPATHSDLPPERPAKRARLDDRAKANPLSLIPLGNLLLPDAKPNARHAGLGSLAVLPDDLVTAIFSCMDAADWLRAQGTSRAFLAWCSIEGLWKVEYLRATRGALRAWHGSWRDTYLIDVLDQLPTHTATASTVASDVLYQPVLCATFDASTMFSSVRRTGGTIRRIDAWDYKSCADLPREPLILSHAIDAWPACQLWSSLDALCQRAAPDSLFRAEASLCTLTTYRRYAETCAQDDSPLYLFHAAPLPEPLTGDFSQPSIFDEDLFALLGDELRPDHLWLIVGPERSGSTFHQDPNGTSAWNAVVSGAKAWVCFHPDVVPPGVRISDDWAEVETPLSVAEWLINYLPAARTRYGPSAKDVSCRGKLLEGVCEAGETFFVPSGWWHLVINLEPSIAITQNYVGIHELPAVLRFLRDRPEQISGLRGNECDAAAAGLYDRFVAALDEPTRAKGLTGLRELDERARSKATRKTRWQEVQEDKVAGFSFGFAVGEELDETVL